MDGGGGEAQHTRGPGSGAYKLLLPGQLGAPREERLEQNPCAKRMAFVLFAKISL